jgi:hypothetical protein
MSDLTVSRAHARVRAVSPTFLASPKSTSRPVHPQTLRVLRCALNKERKPPYLNRFLRWEVYTSDLTRTNASGSQRSGQISCERTTN